MQEYYRVHQEFRIGFQNTFSLLGFEMVSIINKSKSINVQHASHKQKIEFETKF